MTCLLAICVGACKSSPPIDVLASSKLVKVGMTESEVIALLGKPTRRTTMNPDKIPVPMSQLLYQGPGFDVLIVAFENGKVTKIGPFLAPRDP